MYGCETWLVSLTKERRLRAFESRVLREIFGARRVEVTGEWRRLHDEELNDLYTSPNIIRPYIKNNEMGSACSTYEAEERCIEVVGVRS